jgi:hypothetical protein
VIVYFALFILAQISYVLLEFNSVYFRNTLQVLATTIFNLLLLGYSIVQNSQVDKLKRSLEICYGFVVPRTEEEFAQLAFCTDFTSTFQEALDLIDSTRVLRISIIVLMVFFNIIGAFVAYRLFAELGWSIYKSQGADIQKRSILRRYHVFILLLKLNVYFFV